MTRTCTCALQETLCANLLTKPIICPVGLMRLTRAVLNENDHTVSKAWALVGHLCWKWARKMWSSWDLFVGQEISGGNLGALPEINGGQFRATVRPLTASPQRNFFPWYRPGCTVCVVTKVRTKQSYPSRNWSKGCGWVSIFLNTRIHISQNGLCQHQ